MKKRIRKVSGGAQFHGDLNTGKLNLEDGSISNRLDGRTSHNETKKSTTSIGIEATIPGQ